jgi:hypothetical protein
MLTKVSRTFEYISDSSFGDFISQLPGEETPELTHHGTMTMALFVEDVMDAAIIFADIAGFSKISMNIAPMDVMDML